MTRSTTRWLWAGALISVVAACSPPATTDGGDSSADAVIRDSVVTDVAMDGGHDVAPVDTGTDTGPGKDVETDTGPVDVITPDVTMDVGTDVGMDVGPDVAVDTGVDVITMDVTADVAPDVVADVAMDVPAGLCSGAIDLNTAGTVSGSTTSYTGSNAAAPTMAAMVPMTCTTNTGAQVIHTYTTQTRAALRVNTVDSATDFDTVILGVSGCAPGATQIGCNDDFTGTQSQFTSAVLAAGTTVVILVGGYDATAPDTGTYGLHVTELSEIAVGGACDPTGAANICDPTSHCITAGGASTCVADGTLGGRCRGTGTACDAPNACSGSATSSSSRCVAVVPVGGTCDSTGATNVCDPTSHCITAGGASTCVADGTLGGRCRGTGTACDAPNACNGSATSSSSRCVAVVPVGGTCDSTGATNVCDPTAHCLTSGGASTCVADGTLGGRCRGTGTACDAPNACNGSATSSSSRCVPVVAIGGTCDSTGAANVCDPTAHCITSGGASTCVADGSLGGQCRASGTACDAPNGCNGSASSSSSRCVPVVALGGACDPTGAMNVCAPSTRCGTTGGVSTCVLLPYSESTTPAMCDDLSTVGVTVPGTTGDDVNSAIIALPTGFAFSFFGTPVDNYSVASNGFMQLWSGTTGTPTHEYINDPIPSTSTPNNFVAPFWDDFVVTSPASVRTAALGTAPNRTFVVEWNNVRNYNVTGSVLRFQAKLFETTNVIEFHYCTLTPATDPIVFGSSATIGVENAGGTIGVQHSNNSTGAVNTTTAIRYTPNP